MRAVKPILVGGSTFAGTKERINPAFDLRVALWARDASFAIDIGDRSDIRATRIEFPTDIV